MSAQEFTRKLREVGPSELREWIRTATADEEPLFESVYGHDRYQRIRSYAHAESISQGPFPLQTESQVRPNVVVIPGIMGSELAVTDGSTRPNVIWIEIERLIFEGRISELALRPDGQGPVASGLTVSVPGLLRMYFDEFEQFLLSKYNVRHFAFDWRSDLRSIARQLEEFLHHEFGTEPVHLIAHSMGGLVARLLIADRLASGVPKESVLGHGGRLVMLGTPNQGAFEAFKILVGTQDAIQILAAGLQAASWFSTDYDVNVREVLRVVNSFPAVYQMLPHPGLLPKDTLIDFFDASGYAEEGLSLNAAHLRAARETQQRLQAAILPDTMRIIAGCDLFNKTAVGLKTVSRITSNTQFVQSHAGDGTVSHEATKLPGVSMYYVNGDHGELTSLPEIFQAIDDLLVRDPDDVRLSRTPVSGEIVEGLEAAVDPRIRSTTSLVESHRQAATTRFQALAATRRWTMDESVPSTPEIELMKMLVSGWLGEGQRSGLAGRLTE